MTMQMILLQDHDDQELNGQFTIPNVWGTKYAVKIPPKNEGGGGGGGVGTTRQAMRNINLFLALYSSLIFYYNCYGQFRFKTSQV